MAVLSGELELLLVGYAGTRGTERILSEKKEELRARFGRAYLTEELLGMRELPRLSFTEQGLSARHILLFTESGKPVPEGEPDLEAKRNAGEIVFGDSEDLLPDLCCRYGVRKWRCVGAGGVLAALWDFLEEESRDEEGRRIGKPLGCEFRCDRIPLRSITLELCELFGLNPYRLFSENCYLLAAERGYALCEALRACGICCALFGRTGTEPQRIRVDGRERSFLEKSHEDELRKLFPDSLA